MSILKEISPEYSLEAETEAETPVLWPPDEKNWVLGKDPDAGKDWRQEKRGTTEDEMVGCHHWFDGHDPEQVLGVGDGQGSLACCSPWGRRVGHDWATELNWTETFIITNILPHRLQITVSLLWHNPILTLLEISTREHKRCCVHLSSKHF